MTKRHAKWPPEDEPSIKALPRGKSAWVVPWALEVDEDGYCWLDSYMTTKTSSGGTVQMLVTRTESDEYLVEVPEDWQRHYIRKSISFGDRYVPVAEVSFRDSKYHRS